MIMRLRLTLAGSFIGGLMIWACGGEETTTSPGGQQQPPAPTVASVAVTPASATLVSFGETAQLTASAQDASGNTISGKTFTWSSSDVSIATVSSSGLATAIANGAATITATTEGVQGSASLTVAQVVAYVTNFLSNDVSVLATASNTVVATVAVGTQPIGVAITPDGRFAYVTNFNGVSVSVLSTASNTVVATVPVGAGPVGVAITPFP